MSQSETLRQLKKGIDDVFETKARLETFIQQTSQRCPPGVPLRRCFDSAVLVIQDTFPPVGRGVGQPCLSYDSLQQGERDEARRHYEGKLTEAGEKFPEIKEKFAKQFA
jgi:hypothetical protein